MTTLSDIITPTNLVTLTGTQTLTNKTLTAPVIATIVNSGTLTLPTSTDTLVGRAATQTLTNKTLTAPTIASANLTTALTLAGAAGTNGQVLTSAGSGLPTWSTVSAGFTLGTPVNVSGTSVSFTGIPAGTKQIIISFVGVSTNGTSNKLLQIGDSGGIETTGYTSNSHVFNGATIGYSTAASGYAIQSIVATQELHGSITLTLENSSVFTWAATGLLCDQATGDITFTTAGTKSLSAELDRVRLTTSTGTDTFDAGQINIAYI